MPLAALAPLEVRARRVVLPGHRARILQTSLFCVGMTTRSSSAGGSLPFVGGRPRFPRPRRGRAAALRAVEVDHLRETFYAFASTSTPSDAMSVPHCSTEPARPGHRRENECIRHTSCFHAVAHGSRARPPRPGSCRGAAGPSGRSSSSSLYVFMSVTGGAPAAARSRSRPRRRRPRSGPRCTLPSQALDRRAGGSASRRSASASCPAFSISNSKPGISSAWSMSAAKGANSAGGDGRCLRSRRGEAPGTPPPPNGGECRPWKLLRAPRNDDAPRQPAPMRLPPDVASPPPLSRPLAPRTRRGRSSHSQAGACCPTTRPRGGSVWFRPK